MGRSIKMEFAVHEAGCMPPYICHPPAIKTRGGFQEQRVLMLQEVTGFLYSPPFGLFSGPKDSTFENVRIFFFLFFKLNLKGQHFICNSVGGKDWPHWCWVTCGATDVDFQWGT